MCYKPTSVFKRKKQRSGSFSTNDSIESMEACNTLNSAHIQSIACTHPLEMPPPAEKPPEMRSTRFMTRSTLLVSAEEQNAHEAII
jgi:hypothetical protein